MIARGGEAGGHGLDTVGTLPLLQAVLDEVDVPVLAAGGIGTPRGLAAVLAAGAAGAWVGTAFLGCVETAWSQARRDRLLAAAIEDTVYAHVFDIGLRAAWPEEYGGRALRNAFTDRWLGREDELAREPGMREALVAAIEANDFDEGPIYAGQGAGLVSRERTVAEVVADLATAELLLHRWSDTS